MKASLIIAAILSLAAGSLTVPPTKKPLPMVEVYGQIDGPGEFAMFAVGCKEFELVERNGIASTWLPLMFARMDDYKSAERFDGMFVRATGVKVSRGNRDYLLVDCLELRK